MKILVVSAHDAANLSIENVVREFIKRGHKVTIFAKQMEHRHIRMFQEMDLAIHSIKELNKNEIKKYDIAFCPMDGVNDLTFYDIYIFTFNFIFTTNWTATPGDFMFLQTENRPVFKWEDAARMAIGTPKNDTLRQCEKAEKNILFIDTGHYPFGLEGKKQIAALLLEICKQYTDWNVIVKPRWLPNEKNDIHPNQIHLYDVVNELCQARLPGNLKLLYEHLDMQQLIDSAVTVITPGSTAYLDAALRGKNLIILKGLKSENCYDSRSDTIWKQQYDVLETTGCVVNYTEALQFLPYGIRCREEHLKQVVAYRGNVSAQVVDTVEHIVKNFLSHNLFPACKSYRLSDYKHQIIADPNLTWEVLKQKRMKNHVLRLSRMIDWVSADIDYIPLFKSLDERSLRYPVSNGGLKNFESDFRMALNQLWIQEKDKLMSDPIDQSILFLAYAQTQNLANIFGFKSEDIRCTAVYHYYIAQIITDVPQKLYHYYEFLNDANTRDWNMYPQDSASYISRAYNYIFNMYNLNNMDAEIFADLYIDLYGKRDISLVNYNSRHRIHNLIPKVAQLLSETNSQKALKCMMLYAKFEGKYSIVPLKKRIERLEKEKRCISKESRLKRTLLWGPRKIVRGIRCVRENGCIYTLRRMKDKLKNFLKKKDKIHACAAYQIQNIFRTYILDGYNLYCRVIKKYGEGCRLFLSGPATGDAYLYGMFFRGHAARVFPNNIPVYGVMGRPSIGIAKLFGIKHIEDFSIDEFNALYRLKMGDSNDIIHMESMHYHVFTRHTAILAFLEGLHGLNYYSLSRAFFSHITDEEIQQPVFNYNMPSEITDLFTQKKLESLKSVILAPYAKSVRLIPMRFWNRLSEELIRHGITVCTNAAGSFELPVQGTIPVCVPFEYAVPFVERNGAIIGLRSGFLDITSTAKCLKISLICDTKQKRSLVCNIQDSFSMSEMYEQPDQFDMVYTESGEDSLINNIVKLVLEQQDKRRRLQ